MADQDSLIRAILDFPSKRRVRLNFVSWLEERGDTDQADVIRLRLSLESLSKDAVRFGPFERRERQLSLRYRDGWIDQCGLPLTWEQAIALFRRRLFETATWCERKGGTLRTPLLMPPFAELGAHSFEPHHREPSERQSVVNALATTRSRLLATSGTWKKNRMDTLPSGRLLFFYPDTSRSRGIMRVKSKAFLDEDNMPTWDSWVFAADDPYTTELSSHGSFLLCWVPSSWATSVDDAIKLSSERSIQWATDVDTLLTRKLREASLLG